MEDLFLLARANAGEQLRAPEALYLGDLARECVQAAGSLAAAKHITLGYVGDEELPFTGDEALLRRLVMNLLDNAIKFTPPGGTVELSAAREQSMYILQVRDSGAGIPLAARVRLFDRFYRVPAAPPARQHAGALENGAISGGGAGLGLAIARWIADSHGGAIALTRSDETGSTFRVPLPVQDVPVRSTRGR